MTAALATQRLRDLVAPVVAMAGFDLEQVATSRAGSRTIVRVVIDSDHGVTLDQAAEVSHAIAAALEESEESGEAVLKGAFTLEVSSPGVDRPLTAPSHWRRNVGRLVRVRASGRTLEGRISAVTDHGVTLDAEDLHRFEVLGPGKILVEFGRGKEE